MSLYDDVYYALDMGYGSYGAQQDVKKLLEDAAKDAEEKGLVITGYQTLEYKEDDGRGSRTQTYQIPVYNTAEEALVDKLFQEKIASGEYVKAEDLDKVPEAKIYKGDYVSKFAEGGEGYVNPYQSPLEAQKNIPPSGPSSGGTFTGGPILGGIAAGISGLNAAGQVNPGGAGTTFSTGGGGLFGAIGAALAGNAGAIAAQNQGAPPSSTPPSSGFAGQDVLQGFADLKSTPIPELQINPSVSAPVTEALPVNTTYNNSAAIANILGGLSSVTAPISVAGQRGLGASRDFRIMNKPPEATQAVTPAPIPQPYDGLNKTYPPQTSSSGYNFGVMGFPDAPPAPAAQPSPTTQTETRSQGGSDGITSEQKQFMQTVKGLEESARQRAAVERVTRQNMARAGQTADIRLGIQNGRTASGLDAFKRRFKIGQQSPSTNLMINA